MNIKGKAGRLLALTLSAAMVFSFTACGSESTGSAEPEAQDAGVQSLSLATSTIYDSKWDEENEIRTMYYSADLVQLSETEKDEYPELEAALEEMNDSIKAGIDDWQSEWSADIDESIEMMKEYDACYSREATANVVRANTAAVSILYSNSEYDLGAHGSYIYVGYNYDTQTGKKLALEDVITDMPTFLQMVADQINTNYDTEEFFQDTAEYLNEGYEAGNLDEYISWVLDSEGVEIIFNQYAIAPYAAGIQTACFEYDELEGLIDAKYAEMPDSYAMNFDKYTNFLRDFDGDGSLEALYVEGTPDEYDSYSKMTVSLAKTDYSSSDSEEPDYIAQAETDDLYIYDYDTTLLVTPEASYLYVNCQGEDDYSTMLVYKVTGSDVSYVGTAELARGYYVEGTGDDTTYWTEQITDPDSMCLAVYSEVLGTASVSTTYHVGSDGMPEADTSYYTFAKDNPYNELTLLTDLEGESVSEELNADGSSADGAGDTVALAAGDTLTRVRTDAASWIDLMTSDGTYVRLTVDTSDWPVTINGQDVTALFDGIIYAG